MNHYLITQLLYESHVSNDLITKIYKLIQQDKLSHDIFDNTSNFIGSISIDGYTYKEYIDAINEKFPNLIINTSQYYYMFKDPILHKLANKYYSSDGKGLTQEDLNNVSSFSSLYNDNEFNNIQILDLRAFQNAESYQYYKLPASAKYVFLNYADRIQMRAWSYYSPNLKYLYINNMTRNYPYNQSFVGRYESSEDSNYLYNNFDIIPNNNTIVVNGLYNKSKLSHWSSFTWWGRSTTQNLYMNIDVELSWYFTYGTMTDGIPTIENIYVPAVTYDYYRDYLSNVGKNIYEYDFFVDPNNILANNIAIELD